MAAFHAGRQYNRKNNQGHTGNSHMGSVSRANIPRDVPVLENIDNQWNIKKNSRGDCHFGK
jgi:hypothetical protein